jgi:hypothetical protein
MRRPTTYSLSTSVSQSGKLTAVTRGRQLEKLRVSGKFSPIPLIRAAAVIFVHPDRYMMRLTLAAGRAKV